MFRSVHERDGYPIYLPDDLETFVANGEELGAWVAVDEETVVGHVALHPTTWDGPMQVAQQTLGCSTHEIAVVARLAVAPAARRTGVGLALLTQATRAARTLRRRAILDVAAHCTAAISLYEEAGWHHIGTASFPMPDGTTVSEIVFTDPGR
jgi:GNAT superfamily N-acetyltransferase